MSPEGSKLWVGYGSVADQDHEHHTAQLGTFFAADVHQITEGGKGRKWTLYAVPGDPSHSALVHILLTPNGFPGILDGDPSCDSVGRLLGRGL